MERFLNNNAMGRAIGEILKSKDLTMATAESCTGGTIASMVTAIAGSSSYFRGGVVSYAAEVKQQVLGVNIRHGIVSEDTALQMATGTARVCKADCAVATTGVAGPGSSDGCEQGTVCIAAISPNAQITKTFHFNGEREDVILQAADAALELLYHLISD